MASGRRWHASCARAKRTLTECACCSCPLAWQFASQCVFGCKTSGEGSGQPADTGPGGTSELGVLCHAAAAAASVATAVPCWGRGGSVSMGVMHAPCCTAVIAHGHGLAPAVLLRASFGGCACSKEIGLSPE